MKFQDTVLTELRHRYYTSAHKVLRDSVADRKLDIFLSSTSALPEGEHDWSNVLVPLENTNRILMRIVL
jgi:hypothetical protein